MELIVFKKRVILVYVCTGKSLSEALILGKLTPNVTKKCSLIYQFSKYIKTTSSEHVVYIDSSECINKNKKQYVYITCSELVVFMY